MPHNASRQSPQVARRSRRAVGFSLIEMMVAVGIIALLAAVLIPVALRATRTAAATKLAADLQTIGQALEAYRADFGDYPRLNPYNTSTGRTNADRGSVLLAWALIGPYPATASPATPGDGADGNGFRLRAGQGRVYGPYLPVDRFKLVDFVDGPRTLKQLADGYGTPILYFPGKSGTRVAPSQPAYFGLGDTFNYNPADNPELVPGVLLGRLQQAQFTGPFILWSAGADQAFGTKDDVTNVAQ